MHGARSVWLCIAAVCLSAGAQAAESYRLEEPVDDTRVFGVGTRIDVNGKTQPALQKEPLPLVLSAALSYRERRLLGPLLGTDSGNERVCEDCGAGVGRIAFRRGERQDQRYSVDLLANHQGRFHGLDLQAGL